tara:strand:+ start:4407 stop:4598 length:192 start_codon:yes stop_codon:yes gene_type:complete
MKYEKMSIYYKETFIDCDKCGYEHELPTTTRTRDKQGHEINLCSICCKINSTPFGAKKTEIRR